MPIRHGGSSALSPLPPVTTFGLPELRIREVILIFHVAREPDYIAARRA